MCYYLVISKRGKYEKFEKYKQQKESKLFIIFCFDSNKFNKLQRSKNE